MKFGAVLPIWQLTVADAEALAIRAEELGLDGIFVPDHILAKPATTQHYGAHWPDPFALLAFLAGRTRRLSPRRQRHRPSVSERPGGCQVCGHGRPGLKGALHLRRGSGLGPGGVRRSRASVSPARPDEQ